MRLEEYWGVGPKTAERLETELGVPAAVDAIESADVRALVEAGISRPRHPHPAARERRRGMEKLATDDTRAVYKELVSLAATYAVTRHAGDRIRVLTPLTDRAAMSERLDAVEAALETWRGLDGERRRAVLDVFESHDGDSRRAAVETALKRSTTWASPGASSRPSSASTGTDWRRPPMHSATSPTTASPGRGRQTRPTPGAHGRAGPSRTRHLRRARGGALGGRRGDRRVPRGVRPVRRHGGRRGTAAGPERDGRGRRRRPRLREHDAPRTLWELRERADERAEEVAADLRGSISGAREEVDAAVDAVSDLAFHLSLARFADAHDLVRPEFVAHDALAVRNARNLTLAAEDGDVQPVTYAIGDHDLADVPSGDRVAVLTGRTPAGRRRCWRRSARSRCSPRWDSRCPPSARRSDRWTPSSSTAATPRSTRASWKRR